MDCASAKSRMEALAGRTLPESERALVEQHLAMCEGCRLEIELVRAVGTGQRLEGTPQSDWTFDRIFGAEEGADAAAVPPAESAPVVPALSWDFEPADIKPKLAPPEKSLSLAEEALTRHKDADRKKGSTLRLVLWGAGGVAGAALLGFSAWIALHGNTAPEEEGSRAAAPRQLPAAQTAPAQAPESAPPEPADAPTLPQGLPLGSSDVALGTPPAVAPAAPATRDTLLRASSGAAPSPLPAASALGPAAQPKPSPVKLAAPAPSPRGARTRFAPSPATTQPSPRASAAAPKAEPSTPKAAAPAPPGTGASAAERPSSDREEGIVPAQLPPAPAGDAAPEPAPPPEGRSSGITPTPAPAAHAAPPPPAPDDPVAKSAPANQAGAAQPAPANSESAKPIDRLHLATAQAEEQSDLATLRKLKVSWKGFIQKMGVGPDRSRARREFASCLWAIQSLTGRAQDQKEALAAYRDYLLSAPAGGADSESVSRLRQLEDALSERR